VAVASRSEAPVSVPKRRRVQVATSVPFMTNSCFART
jgi:hypothetical protein